MGRKPKFKEQVVRKRVLLLDEPHVTYSSLVVKCGVISYENQRIIVDFTYSLEKAREDFEKFIDSPFNKYSAVLFNPDVVDRPEVEFSHADVQNFLAHAKRKSSIILYTSQDLELLAKNGYVQGKTHDAVLDKKRSLNLTELEMRIAMLANAYVKN